jgi:hypothetical protein
VPVSAVAMELGLAHSEELRSSAEGGSYCDHQDFRWRLAIRVAESSPFANAPLLSKFLLYVCDCTLSNRTEDLTERNIGIVVFQRRPDYKTSEDNIVRSYVRQLRQRLDRYFDEQGSNEPWRIVIPKGGYCADFVERSDVGRANIPISVRPQEPLEQTFSPVEETRARAKLARNHIAWIVLASLLVGSLVGVWGATYFSLSSAAHAIWTEIFTPSSVTYIVTADSGLATLQELTGKHATLQQYVDGTYFAQFDKSDTPDDLRLERLSREHLTGVPDVDTAAGIMGLPEVRGKSVILRNARALSVDDVKDANLILIGSVYSTPWVSLFQPKMNFTVDVDGSVYSSSVINKHPLPGEATHYFNGSTTPPYSTYAVVAFLPSLSGTGRVLLIEGLTTAGTEAASGFLLHGEIASFLKTVPKDKSGLRPFELLLKTTSLDSSSSSTEIVTRRIY